MLGDGPIEAFVSFLCDRKADARGRISFVALKRLLEGTQVLPLTALEGVLSLSPPSGLLSRRQCVSLMNQIAVKCSQDRHTTIEAAAQQLSRTLRPEVMRRAFDNTLMPAATAAKPSHLSHSISSTPRSTSSIEVSHRAKESDADSFFHTTADDDGPMDGYRSSRATTTGPSSVTRIAPASKGPEVTRTRSASGSSAGHQVGSNGYRPLGIEDAYDAAKAYVTANSPGAFASLVNLPGTAVCFEPACGAFTDVATFWQALRAASKTAFPLSHPIVAEELTYETLRINLHLLRDDDPSDPEEGYLTVATL